MSDTPLSWTPRGHVPVFALEPDLLAGVPAEQAEHLRRRVVVRGLSLEPGVWNPSESELEGLDSWLGLLVIEGFAARSVEFGRHSYPDIVGPGDLLRPWDDNSALSSVPHSASWRIVEPTTVVALDERFAAIIARYPSIVAQLLSRSTRRARGLALSLAIVQIRHAETRLLAMLWHLADRWGQMTPDGALVPVPLTHELLAPLVGLRRPSASSALQRLRRAGRVDRLDDGRWLLCGEPLRLDPNAVSDAEYLVAA